MSKEQELYDKFVEALIDKLEQEEPTAKDLEVVMKFVQYQNLQADKGKHKGLQQLEEDLPFDDELPPNLRRIK
jgi:hypothetical protein